MTLVENESAIVTPSDSITGVQKGWHRLRHGGMAVLESLDKPARITKFVELADHFSVTIPPN